ncbi:MAG TPA: 2-amino-4-hydroxy-6-hydroxymethyldihydropteridine diphosphokinase [Methylomusa anaerophila]|uniref:2-amino-4-hydroxy-6-hydroxymethyldihydropteridine diphosphokinase n=1 Tax=Methylomusa anaerophila TaxID=1930071 RepID=A0A348AQ53_9FIRM|nr:2-amino-4-hydroxy-6-hydroxymethyldihydropteridine diphosphokinase [Methylomusa anaerophila]BBB93201.1 2-amino-4-hydroxy-6-hydroxymethyldihydropteridine pyrophosphokinase [Methylomusa anaerophila]HML86967.1 2-amino-4-hydroxy-6-hydroxymethyldihydropteridine diphosphokinase [Methylomusa anaerophila]
MIALGLGSNLDTLGRTREQNIAHAIELLDQHPQIKVKQISSLYETEPVGLKEQPNFLNAAVSIMTSLAPEELLNVCLDIEKQMGRIREVRWGPRNIDIDLLVYDDIQIITNTLELPHPRVPERRFVLIPLREIAGNEPVYKGLTVDELLRKTPDHTAITFYGPLNFSGQRNADGPQ